jgi:hypothetical protein
MVEGIPFAAVPPPSSTSRPIHQQETDMKAITRLAAVALGAMSIAAGVAVAQANAGTEATMNPDTANYGTPPGAALKRDGSLSASGAATGTATGTATGSSSSSSMHSMAADDKSATGTSVAPKPRADRN